MFFLHLWVRIRLGLPFGGVPPYYAREAALITGICLIYLFIIKSDTEYNKHIKEKSKKTNTEEKYRKELQNKKYTNSYKAHIKTLIRHCNKINKSINII